MRGRLVLCAKSRWEPAVRREHALAQQAAASGLDVTFVEQPRDVRAAAGAMGPWARGLAAAGRRRHTAEGVTVVGRSALAPGHRSASAQRLQAWQLRRTLQRLDTGRATVVCGVPWDWPAVAAAPAARRAFDMADDWGELMPGRAERFAALYAQVAAQADAIVVVADELARHFPGRDVEVVRNGVPSWMIGAAAAAPAPARMLYVGTLSPRFDAPLMAQVLDRLSGWSLELVGPCLYPGRGDGPDDELARLLARDDVRWHGPLARTALPAHMDAATVLVVPNRAERSLGQDSMKLYDYAARGRPIVSSRWHPALEALAPPGTRVADDAATFAAAVLDGAARPEGQAEDRRAWAAANTWAARWPRWSHVVLGSAA